MPAPSSYSESMIRDYMYSTTKGVVDVINWTANDFVEPVNDLLIAYGVDTINDATDIAKLRAMAKIEAWRAMVSATSGEFDYSSDSGQTALHYKRSQLHEQAKAALTLAQGDAVTAGHVSSSDTSHSIQFGQLIYSDPYAPDEVE